MQPQLGLPPHRGSPASPPKGGSVEPTEATSPFKDCIFYFLYNHHDAAKLIGASFGPGDAGRAPFRLR
jgi:hypothetical protein